MWPSTRCAFERECASGNLRAPSQANAAAPHHDPCDTLQTGLNTPSIMSRQQQKELLELAVQSVQVSTQLTLSRKAVSARPPCKRIALLNLGGSKQRAAARSRAPHTLAPWPTPAPAARHLARQALGLKTGVMHVEAKYTSRGPRLIEVNCRMGGGPIRCAVVPRKLTLWARRPCFVMGMRPQCCRRAAPGAYRMDAGSGAAATGHLLCVEPATAGPGF